MVKRNALLISRQGTSRFFSASLASYSVDPLPQPHSQQGEETSPAEIAESPESRNPPSSEPGFYTSSLVICKNLSQIKQVHAQIVVNDMLKSLVVANKLLYMYARHKAIGDAHVLFEKMAEKDLLSWSVIAGAFSKAGDLSSCFRVLREMLQCGILPDCYTLPCVIRACRESLDLEMGRLVHDVVWKFGMSSDPFVSAALVDMYAKCGEIGDAKRLFDRMPVRDLVTWTVMIRAFGESGNANESLVLFDRMKEIGLVPDKVTMSTVVNACARLGALRKATLVADYVRSRNFMLDVILGTAMVDMYAKCGSVDLAWDIFEMMREKNVVSWSAMIAAYGYHGLGKKALELFSIMLRNGISPNRITFLSLLHACSHAGLVEEGICMFYVMQDKYSIRPDVKHYTCMVDLYGRAGRLDEAVKLIEDMEVIRDEGVWTALLGACRIHGNFDLAKKAAESLLEMQPQNTGHYVLLSNIYAKARSWEDMAKIRELMTERRLKKIPGWTWIEVGDNIHQFSVWDSKHPHSRGIYNMLKSLRPKLELAGYVPDTECVLQDVAEELKEQMIYAHSEKLAIAFGLMVTPEESPIRITKNLRICGDCHTFCKSVSGITKRLIVVRDANRFHHFTEGACSCGDYW